eukprot:365683-Chlamydomonas_euryale.AAC.7
MSPWHHLAHVPPGLLPRKPSGLSEAKATGSLPSSTNLRCLWRVCCAQEAACAAQRAAVRAVGGQSRGAAVARRALRLPSAAGWGCIAAGPASGRAFGAAGRRARPRAMVGRHVLHGGCGGVEVGAMDVFCMADVGVFMVRAVGAVVDAGFLHGGCGGLDHAFEHGANSKVSRVGHLKAEAPTEALGLFHFWVGGHVRAPLTVSATVCEAWFTPCTSTPGTLRSLASSLEHLPVWPSVALPGLLGLPYLAGILPPPAAPPSRLPHPKPFLDALLPLPVPWPPHPPLSPSPPHLLLAYLQPSLFPSLYPSPLPLRLPAPRSRRLRICTMLRPSRRCATTRGARRAVHTSQA